MEIFLNLKGNINHSVCRWCYDGIPLDKLCIEAKKLGIKSIDLITPDEFEILSKYDLDCGMVYGLPEPFGIENCFNKKENHEELLKVYKELIPKVSSGGYKNVICFSGNRNGMSDDEGLENCTQGLLPIIKIAEENNVNVVIELLNSKVDHPDYQCDHTSWAVDLCNRVNSENFKVLYDIYHMQIMEGDIISSIRSYHPYIGHYHTGGVPGRNEIDQTQELNYPAIMEAIVETGYKGYVAQEFVPKKEPIESLKQGILICDV